MAKTLFDLDGSQLILIADGTYLYCEKSENSDTQRKLYSSQKKRHLIKPFVIVAENGVIIGIYGPFSATTNDAKILELILRDDSALKNLINKKDVMVLDRGFRDVIKHLEQDHELITLMPSCSLEKQLTTIQANCTRMVTKIRNVIERKNGIFKMYAALEKCRNSQLTHITQDFKIVAAIQNCFFAALYSDKHDCKEIALLMKQNLNKPNQLLSYITNSRAIKEKCFIKIDAFTISDFPKILYNDFYKYITNGLYLTYYYFFFRDYI